MLKTIKEEIASNLLFYRKRSNLTQKDLADKLGIKHNSVSAWENGANSIDVEILFKICEILDVSVNDMYGVYSRTNELAFTSVEADLIRKFRRLDERGKDTVACILDQEHSYLTNLLHIQNQDNLETATESSIQRKLELYKEELESVEKGKEKLLVTQKKSNLQSGKIA